MLVSVLEVFSGGGLIGGLIVIRALLGQATQRSRRLSGSLSDACACPVVLTEMGQQTVQEGDCFGVGVVSGCWSPGEVLGLVGAPTPPLCVPLRSTTGS